MRAGSGHNFKKQTLYPARYRSRFCNRMAIRLDGLAKDLSSGDGKKISPVIEIALKENLEDESISEVVPDAEFNKEKGSASLQRVGAKNWRIRLDEIKEGKVLRFIIRTTVDRPVSSRASFETLPLKIDYARTP